eukprot:CAMPEP_0169193566 /NCGR_PEP_ID=MMETSP1016-20121227/6240_1 /TAXON_ID=342587 /ORGANISM="Karlodinium micrum, Strain CCMP2283" /LENGTH=248 /DNA_ID=CAMNT_0009270029 /DNA_START=123 /DNA_END=869 /DNA_ORIENTATION=+
MSRLSTITPPSFLVVFLAATTTLTIATTASAAATLLAAKSPTTSSCLVTLIRPRLVASLLSTTCRCHARPMTASRSSSRLLSAPPRRRGLQTDCNTTTTNMPLSIAPSPPLVISSRAFVLPFLVAAARMVSRDTPSLSLGGCLAAWPVLGRASLQVLSAACRLDAAGADAGAGVTAGGFFNSAEAVTLASSAASALLLLRLLFGLPPLEPTSQSASASEPHRLALAASDSQPVDIAAGTAAAIAATYQ